MSTERKTKLGHECLKAALADKKFNIKGMSRVIQCNPQTIYNHMKGLPATLPTDLFIHMLMGAGCITKSHKLYYIKIPRNEVLDRIWTLWTGYKRLHHGQSKWQEKERELIEKYGQSVAW